MDPVIEKEFFFLITYNQTKLNCHFLIYSSIYSYNHKLTAQNYAYIFN